MDWKKHPMKIMENGAYAGPILGALCIELPPNVTLWFARIPLPEATSCRVVILGANLHVSIGRTSPGFDAAERKQEFVRLEEKKRSFIETNRKAGSRNHCSDSQE